MRDALFFLLGALTAATFTAWRRARRRRAAQRRLLLFLTPRLFTENRRRDTRTAISSLPDTFWNSNN